MNLTLDDMLSPENTIIQERALSRIEEAVDGKDIQPETRGVGEVETDLLSYPVARFIVASVGDKHLIKWFSHHEGERAKFFLHREDMDTVKDIGRELGLPENEGPADMKAKEGKKRFPDVKRSLHRERSGSETGTIWISFTDFLVSRKNISGPDWNLVNQKLVGGLVGVERKSYIRLIQERAKEKVEEGLDGHPPIPNNIRLKEMITSLKLKVEGRRKKYSPTELGKMTITRLPPCMRQILGMSQAGENIPHHARFALVTFLNAVGMSSEEIFKIFTTAPDFKEDIVRYQVEHITGGSSATSYHAPSCDTMKSGGVCFNPDGLCGKEWLNTPLYYYKIKGKKRSTSQENAS